MFAKFKSEATKFCYPICQCQKGQHDSDRGQFIKNIYCVAERHANEHLLQQNTLEIICTMHISLCLLVFFFLKKNGILFGTYLRCFLIYKFPRSICYQYE